MGKCLIALNFILAVLFIASPSDAEQGVTNNQITIGMSTVLTGPASFLGVDFRAGAEAYFSRVNDGGGINGRKIKLIVYDDGYEPKAAVENVTRLIKKDHVFCLFGNVGTPTTVAVKPFLEQENVPLFAPFTGAESLRNPVSRYILNYRASYNQEVEVFIQGVVDTLGLKRIGVFYQDDAYGQAVLDATRQALARRGLSPVATGTYTRNLEDVYNAQETLMAAKPNAVVMAGTYSACAKFISGWKRQAFIKGKKEGDIPIFMNVSFVGPNRLAELMDKYGERVVVTQVVPPIQAGANYPAVLEYIESLRKYSPQTRPGSVSLEGYLAAKVFVEILKRAGKELTREGFIRTAEAVRDLDIQAGNVISFSAQNHQGSQTVYPTFIKDGTFHLIRDWNALK